MRVVSNTSPILNLAIIDQLDLLPQQFDQVSIPPAVVEELKLDAALPGVEQIHQGMNAGWLQVQTLDDFNLVRALERDLDRGESEAIALALQLGYQTVLMDEHEGREAARRMGLRPVGILGVLLRAKSLQQLNALKPVVLALREEAGFYVDERLSDLIFHEAGEI